MKNLSAHILLFLAKLSLLEMITFIIIAAGPNAKQNEVELEAPLVPVTCTSRGKQGDSGFQGEQRHQKGFLEHLSLL